MGRLDYRRTIIIGYSKSLSVKISLDFKETHF